MAPDSTIAATSAFSEALHSVRTAGRQLLIQGGGTHSFIEGEQQAPFINSGKNQVIEYTPADLTLTVGSGMPFVELQRCLQEHQQWLPIEPAVNERSTIGGIVAANVTGASRCHYGGIRSWLIGSQMITTNGDVVHSGSKVVKSVAGYDVHKLLIGSHGTLALIDELTFKVAPLPQKKMIAVVATTQFQNAILEKLRALSPAMIAYCNADAALQQNIANGACFVLRFDGFTEDIDMQRDTLRGYYPENTDKMIILSTDENEVNRVSNAINTFTFSMPDSLRLSVSPSDTAALLTALNDSSPFIADVGTGMIDVPAGANILQSTILAQIETFMSLHPLQARYLWRYNAPAIPGATQQEKELARRLKALFDPENILGSLGFYS